STTDADERVQEGRARLGEEAYTIDADERVQEGRARLGEEAYTIDADERVQEGRARLGEEAYTMITRRERRILAATAALAIGAPAGAAAWVRARTDAVAVRLERAGGLPARIGSIDAEGTPTARIAGIGELSATGVELVPDAAGVRVVTGRVELRGRARALDIDLQFARSAADLSLATMRFGRVLAVGGSGTIAAGP